MKRRVTWSTRSGQFSAVQFICSEPAFMLSLGVRLRFRDMLVGWGQVWGPDVCDGVLGGRGRCRRRKSPTISAAAAVVAG